MSVSCVEPLRRGRTMNPVRIAAFLIATILSGALCAPFDRATGDPMPSAESPAAGGNAATKPRGRSIYSAALRASSSRAVRIGWRSGSNRPGSPRL